MATTLKAPWIFNFQLNNRWIQIQFHIVAGKATTIEVKINLKLYVL